MRSPLVSLFYMIAIQVFTHSLLFLPFAYKFNVPGGSMWNFGYSLAPLPPTVEDHLVLVLGLRDWIWDGIVL